MKTSEIEKNKFGGQIYNQLDFLTIDTAVSWDLLSKLKINGFININFIGLNPKRDKLNKKIELRVDYMIFNGLVNEAKKLYQYKDLNALKTLDPLISVNKKTSYGGTSPRLVKKAISDAKKRFL